MGFPPILPENNQTPSRGYNLDKQKESKDIISENRYRFSPKNYKKFVAVSREIFQLDKEIAQTNNPEAKERLLFAKKHKIYEREQFKTKILFGQNFLIPTKNIPRLELNDKEKEKGFKKEAQTLLEDVITTNELAITDRELPPFHRDAVCVGSSIEFARKALQLFNTPLEPTRFKATLMEFAKENKEGIGPAALANHLVYEKVREYELLKMADDILDKNLFNNGTYSDFEIELAKILLLSYYMPKSFSNEALNQLIESSKAKLAGKTVESTIFVITCKTFQENPYSSDRELKALIFAEIESRKNEGKISDAEAKSIQAGCINVLAITTLAHQDMKENNNIFLGTLSVKNANKEIMKQVYDRTVPQPVAATRNPIKLFKAYREQKKAAAKQPLAPSIIDKKVQNLLDLNQWMAVDTKAATRVANSREMLLESCEHELGPIGISDDRHYLSNLHRLSDGVYDLSIMTHEGAHAMVYIKYQGMGFVLDPNRGLIELHPADHAYNILRLLNHYSVSDNQTMIEVDHTDSHQIQIRKFSEKS